MAIEANLPKQEQPKGVDNNLSIAEAFGFAWEMGYTMTIPLVLLALGGRLLDRWLNSSPIFLLSGIFVSIIISSLALGFKATQIIQRTCEVRKPTGTKKPDDPA